MRPRHHERAPVAREETTELCLELLMAGADPFIYIGPPARNPCPMPTTAPALRLQAGLLP